jgi:hypothetical protein
MASNRGINLLDLISYTGEQSTGVVNNLNNPSAHVVINIDTLSASQYLTVHIIGVAADGSEYTMFTSLPMNKEAVYRVVLAPWAKCVPGISCRDFMPNTFYLKVVPALPAQTDIYSLNVGMGLQ